MARVAFLLASFAASVPLLASAAFAYAGQKPVPPPQSPSLSQEKVDINSATPDQLMKVPGMTRTWAARIVRFRPYRAKSDLLDRGVVTNEVYSRIKNHIVAHRATQ